MKQLVIPNREANLWLEQCDDDSWELKSNKDYILKYMRIIYNDSKNHNKIFAIDPSGGPFISVGYKIGKYKVSEIRKDYRLILK